MGQHLPDQLFIQPGHVEAHTNTPLDSKAAFIVVHLQHIAQERFQSGIAVPGQVDHALIDIRQQPFLLTDPAFHGQGVQFQHGLAVLGGPGRLGHVLLYGFTPGAVLTPGEQLGRLGIGQGVVPGEAGKQGVDLFLHVVGRLIIEENQFPRRFIGPPGVLKHPHLGVLDPLAALPVTHVATPLSPWGCWTGGWLGSCCAAV